MAVPPTIPTSFVPKQSVPQNARRFSGSGGVIMVIASIVLGIAVAAALGTFAYEFYLKQTLAERKAELKEAEAKISEDTVEEFVRLRDRFSSAEILINNHVAFSQFFETLEELTLASVRFSSLVAVVEEDRTVKVEMEGTARNFNALAAQSAAFAGEKNIKRAIFSGITLNEAGALEFTLSAELDPRMVLMEVGELPAAPAPEAIEPAVVEPEVPDTATSASPVVPPQQL